MTASRLRELVEEGQEQGLFPGAVYAVFRLGDGVLTEGVVGLAREERRIPAARETVWDLASLTKPVVTATSILLLAQEGAFTLGEEVSRFLPGGAPALEGISLRSLLTHTSGLPAWRQYHSRYLWREAILAEVREAARQSPVGSAYAYSDLGYILLGEVAAAVSGRPLPELARERIFEPLGMADTGFLPPEALRPRIAATRCPDRGRLLVGEVHDGNCDALGGVAGHAGLFGTLPDLLRYAEMLLREGELDGKRVLPPLAVRQMMRNQNPPGLRGHTLGWFTRPNPLLPAGDFFPDDTFGHTGFTGTSMVLSPSLGLAAVLLTNRVYMAREAADFLAFRRRFHNVIAALI